MSTQTDKAAKRFPFDIWLNKHQQGRSVLQQGKYEGYLAALSELDAQPSPTEDLEARAREWHKAKYPSLYEEHPIFGVCGDTDVSDIVAFARSIAQPSAPTVDQIMEVVRKADKDWHDYYDDEEFWEDLRARLTKLLTNP